MTAGADDGLAIAAQVRSGARRALDVTEDTLATIAAGDEAINSFTAVFVDRVRREAARVDAVIAAGEDPGPLAGIPFAVKNLFDVAGEVTVSGSSISRADPPATTDAAAVAAMVGAGAVLVGALNMDEYAYGFTTENSHYGPCRNPHDLARVAGGSSGGSGAAVAAGFVPVSLGSDTNGSVRVPAALCGIFGLKPTYGRLSRRGMYPFCGSLDHVGVLARSVRDLAISFDVLHGHDPGDPVTSTRARQPISGALGDGISGLRIAVLGDYFARGATAEALAVVGALAEALGADARVSFPEAARARSAAMIITAAEGAQHHLHDLRTRAAEFDPMTRDRFLAGAMIPASAYVAAQRFRRWFRGAVAGAMASADIVLAPTTPFPAPFIGQREAVVDGETVLTQPYLGCFTQPLSFVGLPVLTVPAGRSGDGLPLGVQLVAAPYREEALVRVGAELERRGLAAVAAIGAPA